MSKKNSNRRSGLDAISSEGIAQKKRWHFKGAMDSDVNPRKSKEYWRISLPKGIKVYSKNDLYSIYKDGADITYISKIKDDLGIPQKKVSELISIPERTLLRVKKENKKLSPEQYERAHRFARLISIASDVLGSSDQVKKWFNSNNTALGNVPPIEYARTETGAREVENCLMRIEHGSYS